MSLLRLHDEILLTKGRLPEACREVEWVRFPRADLQSAPGRPWEDARPALRPVYKKLVGLGQAKAGNARFLAKSHMWTAPGLQDLAQRTDRSDCDHMSGLSRSHMTAAKMGSATRVPNRKATFEEGHWDA